MNAIKFDIYLCLLQASSALIITLHFQFVSIRTPIIFLSLLSRATCKSSKFKSSDWYFECYGNLSTGSWSVVRCCSGRSDRSGCGGNCYCNVGGYWCGRLSWCHDRRRCLRGQQTTCSCLLLSRTLLQLRALLLSCVLLLSGTATESCSRAICAGS